MRVRLLDRYGGGQLDRTVGSAAFVVALISLPLSFVVPKESVAEIVARTLPFLSLSLLSLVLAVPLRFSPRTAEVTVHPGELRVEGGIGRTFRIVPGDVTGATTSAHGEGVALSLMLATRPRAPVTFVFDGERDAETARRALGLGHDGFGETSWRVEESTNMRASRIAAFAALSCFLAGAYAAASSSAHTFHAISNAVYGLFCLPFAYLRFLKRPSRRIALRPEAAYLPTADGCATVPYGEIARLEREARTLHVRTGVTGLYPLSSTLVPLEELELVESHLQAARQRALGQGPPRVEVRERLAQLERNSEPIATWLARLDMLGKGLGAGGYRGHAIDRADLDHALDDADLPLEARVAAARVLAQVDHSAEMRTRIAETAATLRNPKGAEVLRAASCEAAELEHALEELERDEIQRAAVRPLP
jgi:hypothetical protein